MNRFQAIWLVGFLAAVTGAASALAQQTTTVQLPTFNFTTVQTTVSVPDGGTGLLGGIKRASEGSVTRGVPVLSNIPGVNRLFRNRGIGRDVGLSNMTIVPRIIILEEEEFRQTGVSPETLSGRSTDHQSFAVARGIDPAVARQADFIARNIARHEPRRVEPPSGPALPSVEETRRRNELAMAERAAEAAEFFAEGQRAEAEGKTGAAKVYYQMAARRATGELLGQIAARLAVMEGAADGTRLAGR
jgi:hypothetical protein